MHLVTIHIKQCWSLPTWERGLKLAGNKANVDVKHVAPYVGAWIEISTHTHNVRRVTVAPYVGAWIEISR